MAAMLLASCTEKKQEPIVTPWGEVLLTSAMRHPVRTCAC